MAGQPRPIAASSARARRTPPLPQGVSAAIGLRESHGPAQPINKLSRANFFQSPRARMLQSDGVCDCRARVCRRPRPSDMHPGSGPPERVHRKVWRDRTVARQPSLLFTGGVAWCGAVRPRLQWSKREHAEDDRRYLETRCKERRFAIAHDRLPVARRPLRIPNRRSRLWNGIRCVGRQSPDEPRLGNTECEPAVARGRLEKNRCA